MCANLPGISIHAWIVGKAHCHYKGYPEGRRSMALLAPLLQLAKRGVEVLVVVDGPAHVVNRIASISERILRQPAPVETLLERVHAEERWIQGDVRQLDHILIA